jgi:hypothetical protein
MRHRVDASNGERYVYADTFLQLLRKRYKDRAVWLGYDIVCKLEDHWRVITDVS